MQHVKLGVDNLYPKFHEVVIKNEKVPGGFMLNIKCFLKTGSTRTGRWQREIPYAVRFAIETLKILVSDAYGFS